MEMARAWRVATAKADAVEAADLAHQHDPHADAVVALGFGRQAAATAQRGAQAGQLGVRFSEASGW